MIRVFKTIDGKIHQIHHNYEMECAEKGCWVALTKPTLEELKMVAAKQEIDIDDLKSALDEEERSRLVVEDKYTMLVLDLPTTEIRNEKEYFYTIPFGIIMTEDIIVTVCLEDTQVLTVFMDGRVRGFDTNNGPKFIFQMLYRNATMYLQYLRIIDRKSEEVEKRMHKSQKNQDLMDMHEIQKSLVYITTSLRGNELVLEKLTRNKSIPKTEDEEELLEDVIIENKQAIEMARIYSDILTGTMDAYSNVINNNVNAEMKFLTIVTIVLTMPTIVSSAFGMNLGGIPYAQSPMGFLIINILSIVLALITGIFFGKFQKSN